MKVNRALLVAPAILAVTPAMAVVFSDATGDLNSAFLSNNVNYDLTSLEITNTATSISFKLTTAGTDITDPSWEKFNIIIRNGSSNLDTSATGNGWGRNYSLAGGANGFIGGWVDGGGGFEARTYNGSSWDLNGATYNGTAGLSMAISGNSVTYTTTLASLGLNLGDTFTFDGISTAGGGSDSALDVISTNTATVSDWGVNYTSNSNLTYTVSAVPEPTTIAGLALGALALIRKRKSSK